MGFRIIRGSFHVAGYSPDGDSIRFQAKDPSQWSFLNGPPPRVNARGHVQLRLEAIDTLETHFNNYHQPLELAEAALAGLLKALSITDVVWDAARKKVLFAQDSTPGFIVTREVEKNGRPVAFAFGGDRGVQDGPVFLDDVLLDTSVNAFMLESGQAYPTFYKGLFSDLRLRLIAAVSRARSDRLGVWALDATTTGAVIDSMETLCNDVVILPKLFRRLVEYLEGGGSAEGFRAFMRERREEVMIISDAHATHFDTVIEENGNQIRLIQPPENLLFTG